jgi:hypothetical protein
LENTKINKTRVGKESAGPFARLDHMWKRPYQSVILKWFLLSAARTLLVGAACGFLEIVQSVEPFDFAEELAGEDLTGGLAVGGVEANHFLQQPQLHLVDLEP